MVRGQKKGSSFYSPKWTGAAASTLDVDAPSRGYRVCIISIQFPPKGSRYYDPKLTPSDPEVSARVWAGAIHRMNHPTVPASRRYSPVQYHRAPNHQTDRHTLDG